MNETQLAALTAGLFIITLLLPPLALLLLPEDYLCETDEKSDQRQRSLAWKVFLTLFTNLLGGVILLAGIIMLFIPGQGLLTIALGILLTSLPGKKKALSYILTDSILDKVNTYRTRFGRPPLKK